VKLLVPEAETDALARALEAHAGRLVTSEVSEIEVGRAAARYGVSRERAEAALARFALLALDDGTRSAAVRLEPAELRTLDAIHLATALNVGDSLAGFVCYDARLATAANRAGMAVLTPARGPAGPGT
jgi:predicted nucleic acid-binding protein